MVAANQLIGFTTQTELTGVKGSDPHNSDREKTAALDLRFYPLGKSAAANVPMPVKAILFKGYHPARLPAVIPTRDGTIGS